MTINYEYLYAQGLTDTDYHNLQKIKQKQDWLLQDGSRLDEYLSRGWIEYIKNGKPRLTKLGHMLMSKLNEYGYTEEIGNLHKELIQIYEKHGYDERIGNPKELLDNLIWFCNQVPFNHEIIKHEVKCYLDENVSEQKYCPKIPNLIWKRPHHLNAHRNLAHSKLAEHMFVKYKMFGDATSKPSKGIKWLIAVSNLPEPVKYYLTGSKKGDVKLIETAKTLLRPLLLNR